jgi:hypothetical protein
VQGKSQIFQYWLINESSCDFFSVYFLGHEEYSRGGEYMVVFYIMIKYKNTNKFCGATEIDR